ncbi:MAG: nuclear transport factor 2 family protein, partial [Rhodospirillaceae bacterium]|nr:nuclear transport factor 2 family protein [Rhodospirillaceae bacterium]
MALRLEDIELIKRLKGKYFRSIDTCDIPALEDMFTPDATVCYVGGTYRWEANSRAEIVAGLKASFH